MPPGLSGKPPTPSPRSLEAPLTSQSRSKTCARQSPSVKSSHPLARCPPDGNLRPALRARSAQRRRGPSWRSGRRAFAAAGNWLHQHLLTGGYPAAPPNDLSLACAPWSRVWEPTCQLPGQRPPRPGEFEVHPRSSTRVAPSSELICLARGQSVLCRSSVP